MATYRTAGTVLAVLGTYVFLAFAARVVGLLTREQTLVATVGGAVVAAVVLLPVGWRALRGR